MSRWTNMGAAGYSARSWVQACKPGQAPFACDHDGGQARASWSDPAWGTACQRGRAAGFVRVGVMDLKTACAAR